MRANTILGNGSTSHVLKGTGLKHRVLNQYQRANLAADVVAGFLPFRPSCEQASWIFNVPRPLLRQQLKARREWATRHPEVANGNGAGGLVEALRTSTAAERIGAARALGLDWVWDEMIAPGIQADRSIASA
jgi:hypothetical protein